MQEVVECIDTMIDSRVPFRHIEAMIENRRDLGDDSRSALWLYAWVETDRAGRRQAVGELLVGVVHVL